MLLVAMTVAGMVPRRLVAAEPGSEKTPARTGIATLDVWESRDDRPESKTRLCTLQVYFNVGCDPTSEMRDIANRRIEMSIHSRKDAKPLMHEVKIKITRDLQGKNPIVVAAPRLLLCDGTPGTVAMHPAWDGGPNLDMEVTIGPYKPAPAAPEGKQN
jgi:hypothetical protein